jgi:hypothetical protein
MHKWYEYAAAATQLFNASDILIYVTYEEQTGCVSSCQTVAMDDSSRRRKAAISSELKTFPYVAQRKTRTRLMGSFKDCLIGDASFSCCLANHGNCKLLELSHQMYKRASFSLCVTSRQRLHADQLHTLHNRYTHRDPQATCVPPACIMRLAATFAHYYVL